MQGQQVGRNEVNVVNRSTAMTVFTSLLAFEGRWGDVQAHLDASSPKTRRHISKTRPTTGKPCGKLSWMRLKALTS